MSVTTVNATGLTCQHCAASVTEEIQDIDNVTDVTVDVVPGAQSTVTITHDGDLDPAAVKAAIEEAGYQLAT